jgi:hypothetical protein
VYLETDLLQAHIYVWLHAAEQHSEHVRRREFHCVLHGPLWQPVGEYQLPARVRFLCLSRPLLVRLFAHRSLDPSIRITYPPISKQLLQSGFYKKSATHGFTQSITVYNTKSVPVDGLCIVDQIPASRNAQVKVNLVQPAHLLGEGEAAGKGAAGAEPDAGRGLSG